MPAIARGIGSGDLVTCEAHGAPGSDCGCCLPLVITTDQCSSNVMVAGTGAVRVGDTMTAHPRNYGEPSTLCNPHTPPCSTGSSTVMVNGKPVARMGDEYFLVNNHTITTVAQSTVMAG